MLFFIILFIILLIIMLGIIGGPSLYKKWLNKRKKDGFEKWYGKGCPENKLAHYFDILLSKWNKISKRNDIRYSISYGSYLGWLRNQNYIPYDEDLDIQICYRDIDKLLKLARHNWCYYADQLKHNIFKKGQILLILNRSHNVSFDKRIRYSCQGVRVDRLIDDCSFNGPVARLIYRPLIDVGKRYLHIDIYLYHEERDPKKRKIFNQNREVLDYAGSYSPFTTTLRATTLPPTKNCYLNGLSTKCFVDNLEMMETYYTKNFLKPSKTWDNVNKKWLS